MSFGIDRIYLLLSYLHHDARANSNCAFRAPAHLFTYSSARRNTASQKFASAVRLRYAALPAHISTASRVAHLLSLTPTSKLTRALRRAIECALRAASDTHTQQQQSPNHLTARRSETHYGELLSSVASLRARSQKALAGPEETPSSMSALGQHLRRSSSR
jgi:hypothetical protein